MWSAFILFVGLLVAKCCAADSTSPKLLPRSLSLHLQSRQGQNSSNNNSTTFSGISPVGFSNDKLTYYTLIKLGAIYFRVALDTASSDLWVTSTDCGTATCKSAPRYPLTYQSPSFVSVNGNQTAFSAGYDDKSAASGFVARESVKLANLTVPNQAFALVTNSNVTMNDQVSGILGLGFPRLSSINSLAANATPFFVSLAEQGMLDYPLFGLSLNRGSNGSLSIGAVDSSVVKNMSHIGWSEVVPFSPFKTERNTSSYLQWAIPLTGFSVNETRISPLPTYSNITANLALALIDVGTAGIYGPFQDVSRLFDALDGSRIVDASGQWAVPCDIQETITFQFGGQNYTMLPTDYLIGPASGNPNLCLTWPRALPPSSDGIDWQFGQAFLRTVYSIFSYGINSKEPPMIGLYPLYKINETVPSSQAISSFLSSASATVATTLPNFPIPTPTFTTPSYIFNTSVPTSLGGVATSELATSTYEPLIEGVSANITGLPTVSPAPTVVTFVLTNPSGVVITSTSFIAAPTFVLGVPPGWSAGFSLTVPRVLVGLSWAVVLHFIL